MMALSSRSKRTSMASHKRKPYDKVNVGGFTLDRYTYRMLREADRRFHKRTGKHFIIAQGSYNKGGVDASAGTHDGPAVDLAAAHLEPRERRIQTWCMRSVGFGDWGRKPPIFPYHDHGIPFGNPNVARYSPLAASQLRDYDRGLNGLANHAPDPTPRPSKRRWSWRLNKPVPRR